VIGQEVRNAGGRARLPHVIINAKAVHVRGGNGPICIQIEQDILTVINLTLIRSRACRSLDSPAQAVILVIDSEATRQCWLCQLVLLI